MQYYCKDKEPVSFGHIHGFIGCNLVRCLREEIKTHFL